MKDSNINLAIVMPVYNDWFSAFQLIENIDRLLSDEPINLSIYIVDDASTEVYSKYKIPELSVVKNLTVIEATKNLGHQRAIAIGLCYIGDENFNDAVIVADSDGEDRPEDIKRLIDSYIENKNFIYVGQRVARSENTVFKIFYFFYKKLFKFLTGKVIDFGNFCLIPKPILKKLILMPELWNHTAASIVRSKAPLKRLPTKRGVRYGGKSTMNLTSLVIHGLCAISVFLDVLLVRMLIGILFIGLITALATIFILFLRVFTKLSIPGWASTMIALAGIVFLQSITFLIISAFIIFSSRSSQEQFPREYYKNFIEDKINLL